MKPFDFQSSTPPLLAHWAGLDLVDAAHGGEALLSVADGRRVALLRADRHNRPGDSVNVPGVTQRLQLSALIGVVVGGSHEAWNVVPLWNTSVRRR